MPTLQREELIVNSLAHLDGASQSAASSQHQSDERAKRRTRKRKESDERIAARMPSFVKAKDII